MIVVFDSADWISALHFEGVPLLALEKAFRIARIACCDDIRTEVREALTGKFNWLSRDVEIAMDKYLQRGLSVSTQGMLRGVCRDPNDDMILECALLAKADFIVSGDSDLLVLQSYRGTRILKSRMFLNDVSLLQP